MMRRRGGVQEEYRDVYLRNLNLLNNQMVADAAFDMIYTANKLRHIRVNPKTPRFDKEQNLFAPVLEHKLGYLFAISKGEVKLQQTNEREKKTIDSIHAILQLPYGAYDVTSLFQLAFDYYDILLRLKIIGITHGREEETLKAKLDKW